MSDIIYRVGKENTPQGSFFVLQDTLDDSPIFCVYFKRTGEKPEEYYVDNYRTAKEACLEVDRQVSKWIGYDIQ